MLNKTLQWKPEFSALTPLLTAIWVMTITELRLFFVVLTSKVGSSCYHGNHHHDNNYTNYINLHIDFYLTPSLIIMILKNFVTSVYM